MRLPTCDHLLLNRATHRSCLQKMGFMGQVLFLLFLVLALVPLCVYGQIGNLGWAEGAKPEKRIVNYYESARFQFSFEPGAGILRNSISTSVGPGHQDEGEYTDTEFLLDTEIGASYRLFLSSGDGAGIDLSLHASVGANTKGIDLGSIRLIGAIAPEIGIKLAAKGKRLARPFFSFGPGLSVFEDNYGGGDSFGSLWVFRIGTEIGSVNAPYSGIIGIKLFKRSEKKWSRDYWSYQGHYQVDCRTNEKDLLLFLGFCYRIA